MSNFPIDEFINSGIEDEMTIVSSSNLIKGYFHNEYDTLGLQTPFEASFPWFECRTDDLEDVVKDQAILINDEISYYIKELQNNGTGYTVVILYK